MRLRRNPAGSSRATLAPSSPKPTDEANGCKLGHVAPKMLQKAQYVGFSESAQPLQVVYFGWPRFPVPGSAPRTGAGPNLRSEPADGLTCLRRRGRARGRWCGWLCDMTFSRTLSAQARKRLGRSVSLVA